MQHGLDFEMRDFKELYVWQRPTGSHSTSTARRVLSRRRNALACARSSAAPLCRLRNIAEGCGRDGERELARFLGIAAGSASEAEYQLLLSRDLGYLPAAAHIKLDAQANEIKKMLRSLMQKLTAKANG